MTRPLIVLLFHLASSASGILVAQEMIAHQTTGAPTMTRNEARLLFSMRLPSWPNGTRITVFVLPDDNPLHREFATNRLGLYPYQLRHVWDRQVFSGTGQAPVIVTSEQELIDRVLGTPGAIGYVRVVPNDDRIHAINIH
jgi:hypothetical protein